MNLKSAAALLSAYLDADIPAMLWGAPGVGKSAIIKQIADERGQNVIDFRASTRDPVALMGLPNFSDIGTTQWRVPDEFPQVARDGAKGILFLDELNAAAPSMQAAMFGLVLDRKVGDYTLPEGWRVIAAGNRQADRAAAQRMPSALMNRLAHIDVEPDVDTTVEHFNNRGFNPMVTAFLRFRPELLHSMPGSNRIPDDARAFPTPRSWEKAAIVADLPSPLRLQAVSGIVGDGPAAEFEGFVRVYKDLPSLDLVLANPNSAPIPGDPAGRFAISSGLARKVTDKTIDNGLAYMKRLPREFSIMFMVDAVRRDAGLSHTNAFTNWSVDNQDVVFG